MSKRPAFDMKSLQEKKARMDEMVANQQQQALPSNPFLSQPVQPESALQIFFTQVRNAARKYLPAEHQRKPITKPFCEVEARLGILHVASRRVTSSGAKLINGHAVASFDCSRHNCSMLSGISRSTFSKLSAGISEVSRISQALGVTKTEQLKRELVETSLVETVYTGYSNQGRVCFEGEHPSPSATCDGKMESKDKLITQDLAIPAANLDVRITLSSEKIMDPSISEPPAGWKSKRVKRRRSYCRSDRSIKWQIDVTEVTTTSPNQPTSVDYEVEMEVFPDVLLKLINEENEVELKKMTASLSEQLWWMLSQLNPLSDVVDVEETLRDHPDTHAVSVARATCGALRKYLDDGGSRYDCPIGKSSPPPASLSNVNFVGCMPVNFSRHNIEEIQRSPDNGYFISEKTDGVRHFMVFTGDTVVLVDRAMRGKQPISDSSEPFAAILNLIQPGTVLDGEVVMSRKLKKPRPVFIVFDVLAISTTQPVLQLPFEQRFRHLRQASFRTPTAQHDMFDARFFADPKIALPLVRKNFVTRSGLDELFSRVEEERGMRCYKDGELHHHLTDGIIFQPNLPYICGTDVNLLKWKYLDTVTIDVEILPLRHTDDDSVLRVACLGEEQTRVDMTRYVQLPKSERLRLEADKFESGGRIAEVGFDPETGEWYYLTMRSDKIAPNHISTVLGTLLELAESLTTDELRYRMNVPAGARDMYRKEKHSMLRQLLSHQQRQMAAQKKAHNGGHHR